MDSKTIWAFGLGIYLTIWIAVLVALLFGFWPNHSVAIQQAMDSNAPSVQSSVSDQTATDANQPGQTAPSDPASQESDSAASLVERCPISGLRFVKLVLIIGALGACLHGITSLAYHCSQNNFSQEWIWWYFYRPFAGGLLALIFYLIINGGFMSPVNSNDNRFFVILGVSGMIGLFSNQALDRLSLIFDAMFASKKDKNAKFYRETQPESGSQGQTATDETPTTEKPPEETQS